MIQRKPLPKKRRIRSDAMCQHVYYHRECIGCRWHKKYVIPELLKVLARW